jgi:hypothetical protein
MNVDMSGILKDVIKYDMYKIDSTVVRDSKGCIKYDMYKIDYMVETFVADI